MKHLLARAFLELTKLLSSAHAAALSKQRGRAAELAGLRDLVERQQLEIDLLRARLARLDSAKRPRYLPHERLQILLYRVKWPTSLAELARRFVLSVETIKEWMVEVDGGVESRVKTKEPVNKLPDAVREIALLLRWEQLRWGCRRIADVLRRLNVKISRTSIQRILRRSPRRPAVEAKKSKPKNAGIHARRQHDLWLVDITRVKDLFGLLRVHVAAVVDGYTRAVLAIGVCRSEPTAAWMTRLFARAMLRAKAMPRHLITDQGSQFTAAEFQRMLKRRGIRHRFGAVGKKGSIAIIERFWRTLKTECLDATCVRMSERMLAGKLSAYLEWYRLHRPHQGLGGRTPQDVSAKVKRTKPLKINAGDVLRVVRRDLDGDRRLPVYTLRVKKSA